MRSCQVQGGGPTLNRCIHLCSGSQQGFDDREVVIGSGCQVQGDVTVPVPSCYICTSR